MHECEYAVVDADGGPGADASTAVVPWWSFTKTLIAAGILRLAEQGRLALDEPLENLPYTTRQLLQHRAGVGDYGGLAEYHAAVARHESPWSDAAVFERIPPDKLLFEPDAGWAYSNVGYLLLRRTIERICDENLGPVLHGLVLEPLGLSSSSFAETTDDMRGTTFSGGHGYHPGWAFHGFVIGPASEAALALHRLLHGELLTPSSRRALLQRVAIGGPVPGRPWQTTGYGLGLMMGTMHRPGMGPLEVVGHSAGGPGSVGAVYHTDSGRTSRTVAVFRAGSDEGAAEDAALLLLGRGLAG